ncbi:sugar ABC transporter substrate-binding protein [Gulosibacter molinativorax]|uniref:Sugar ABC transporter substrate-binding protein n=1 Tax=Gulosibacter molinativorax TaxID=256821 RepID=A0ABT7C7T2_9MICO|nr:sugar ABC transporter substrate-binding protein [Gulosibacter molinativorax]
MKHSGVEYIVKSLRGLKRFGLAAIAASAALLLAACGGPAGVTGENRETAGSGAGANVEKTMTVAMITHSTPGDTFWDIVRKGAEAAAAKDGIELLYSSDPDGAKQSQLVEQAIDQGVDGIIVTLAKPEAMTASVEKAVAAGIPVFSINSGQEAWEAMGVLAHFGQDELVSGQAAGDQFNELGAQNVICVIHEQGNVGHESRCQGVDETLDGKMEIVYVNAADPTNVQSTIAAKLQADASIDYILTLGAPQAAIALTSIEEAGSGAKLATFDLNADVVAGLQNGDLQFAVDQQPYLQGYEAMDAVWLYQTNGNVLGGGLPVLTGPSIVTPDQADTLSEYVDNGTR